MRYLKGKNVGYLNMKCINCNSYFNFDELYKRRIGEVLKPKSITNADRIRAMTDEELANFVSLCCGWTCAECPVGKECNGDECFSTWLGWLKQEAQCTSE
jgi:hypothetical protein